MQRTSVLWQRLDIPGREVAELVSAPHGWTLWGVALLAHEKRPCRLEYRIDCDGGWQTRAVTIHGHLGAMPAELELTRDAGNAWYRDGTLIPALHGCIDVDLGFSPSTNLLPIRRLGLRIGQRAEVRAAWVRFPELTLEVLEQVYTRTGTASYLYESARGAFRRELAVDADGFVLEYPDFWRVEATTSLPTATHS